MKTRQQGKSWAVPSYLFNEWLATNFNPLPDSEVQMLMWQAWIKSWEIRKRMTLEYETKITNQKIAL